MYTGVAACDLYTSGIVCMAVTKHASGAVYKLLYGFIVERSHDTVLCDVCDDCYHLSCVEEDAHTIPTGRWCCMQCRQCEDCGRSGVGT
jgi:hypothetical protein